MPSCCEKSNSVSQKSLCGPTEHSYECLVVATVPVMPYRSLPLISFQALFQAAHGVSLQQHWTFLLTCFVSWWPLGGGRVAPSLTSTHKVTVVAPMACDDLDGFRCCRCPPGRVALPSES